jgi:hypothetical protein
MGSCWGITAIDVDNDGWIDLAAVGERCRRCRGTAAAAHRDGRFADVSAAASGSLRPAARALVTRTPTAMAMRTSSSHKTTPADLLKNNGGGRLCD